MKDITQYPKTKLFEVVDTIGVPHPYCVGSAHVAYASDNFSGMLGTDAIRSAEQAGKASCDICEQAVRKGKQEKILTIDEHKQALLINCKTDDKVKLKKYLLSIKERTVKDGFEGFALKKGW